ncbi:MAG: rSAM/selenodomain-associated transferase 2 [bacterium]|jgi:rSAM/selenodomain-associated transferase 2
MEQSQRNKPLISIIIPTLNEEAILTQTLGGLPQSDLYEVIISDAGSTDKTIAIGKKHHAIIIQKGQGRAIQMNEGAKIAQGKLLLFLHADTLLPESFVEDIQSTLEKSNCLAGAFRLGILSSKKRKFFIELLVLLRSVLFELPYGDQAIFLPQEVFWKYQGFPELPIMEDFNLIQQIKKDGKVKLTKTQVQTSGRRWETLGFFWTTIINQFMILGYYLQVPPQKLSNFYQKQQKNRFTKQCKKKS